MDEDLEDPRVDAALNRLLASEVSRARRDVRSSRAAAGDAATRRRLRVPGVVLRGLVIGAVITAATLGGLAVASWRSSLDSTSRTPQIGARYADGIPMELDGQKVLRGAAAIEAARESVDSAPFLVGVWAARTGVSAGPAYPATLDAPHGLPYVGDKPGFLDQELGTYLRYYDYKTGPLVLRVHTHDVQAADKCAAENRDMCLHIMLADVVLWRGDSATDPAPISVDQAAAAFGVENTPFENGWNACPGMPVFPGVAMLDFPRANSADISPVHGIVMVFPSRQAALEFAPAAKSTSETDAVPAGIGDCGSNPTHWLFHANLVVGVGDERWYELGAQGDPWIDFARQALSRLPD